jgi:hypothetical protein
VEVASPGSGAGRVREAGTGSADAFGAEAETGKSDGAPSPSSCPGAEPASSAVVVAVAMPGPGGFTREGADLLPGSGAGITRALPAPARQMLFGREPKPAIQMLRLGLVAVQDFPR